MSYKKQGSPGRGSPTLDKTSPRNVLLNHVSGAVNKEWAKPSDGKVEIVEEHFKFFQIENKLRKIVYDILDPMRTRIAKEGESTRNNKHDIEQVNRNMQDNTQSINKLLLRDKTFDKVFQEIANLESTMNIEFRKQTELLNNYDVRFDHVADDMQMLTKEHLTRMAAVDKCEQDVCQSIDMIQKFKDKFSNEVTDKIQELEHQIQDLVAPQAEMNRKIDHNEQTLEQLSKENKTLHLDNEHLQWKIENLEESIKQLRESKVEKNPFSDFIELVDKQFKDVRLDHSVLHQTVKKSINHQLRFTHLEIKNQINSILQTVLRPLQIRDLAQLNIQRAAKKKEEDENKVKKFTFDDDPEDKEEDSEGTGMPKIVDLRRIDWIDIQGKIKDEWSKIVLEQQQIIDKLANQAQPEASSPTRVPVGPKESSPRGHRASVFSKNSKNSRQSRNSKLQSKISGSVKEESEDKEHTTQKDKEHAERVEQIKQQKAFMLAKKQMIAEEKKARKSRRQTKITLESPQKSSRKSSKVTSTKPPTDKSKDRRKSRRRKTIIQAEEVQVTTGPLDTGILHTDEATSPKLTFADEDANDRRSSPRKTSKSGKSGKKSKRKKVEIDETQNAVVTSKTTSKTTSKSTSKEKKRRKKIEAPLAKSAKTNLPVNSLAQSVEGKRSYKEDSSPTKIRFEEDLMPEVLQKVDSRLMSPSFAIASQSSQQTHGTATQRQTPVPQKSPQMSPTKSSRLSAQSGARPPTTKHVLVDKKSSSVVSKRQSQDVTPAQESQMSFKLQEFVFSSEGDGTQGLNITDSVPQTIEMDKTDFEKRFESSSEESEESATESSEYSGEEEESESEYDSELWFSSSDSSEASYEEDEYEIEQDAADAALLGVDLTKFCKAEAFRYYYEKLCDRLERLKQKNEVLTRVLKKEVRGKRGEFTKGINMIEKRIQEEMVPIRADTELMMKTRQRNKADDLIEQQKVCARFDKIQKEHEVLKNTINNTLCPFMVILFENQCIQLQAEEQDEIDKMNIALYGQEEKKASQDAELIKANRGSLVTGKTCEKPSCIKEAEERRINQQTSIFIEGEKPRASTSPQKQEIDTLKSTLSPVMQSFDQSLFQESIEGQMDNLLAAQIIQQSLATQSFKPFQNEQIRYMHASNWTKKQAKNDVISLKEKCLTCADNKSQINKLFKTACLAYQASQVPYRGQFFNREQLMVLRKFLVGQCAQIMHQSTLLQSLGLNTKNIFDGLFLYVQHQSTLPNANVLQQAEQQWSLIQESGQQPSNIKLAFTKTLSTHHNQSLFDSHQAKQAKQIKINTDLPKHQRMEKTKKDLSMLKQIETEKLRALNPTEWHKPAGVSKEVENAQKRAARGQFLPLNEFMESVCTPPDELQKTNTFQSHNQSINIQEDSLVESISNQSYLAPRNQKMNQTGFSDNSMLEKETIATSTAPTANLQKLKIKQPTRPIKLNGQAQKHLKNQGCFKEQNQQWKSLINEAIKSNHNSLLMRQTLQPSIKESFLTMPVNSPSGAFSPRAEPANTSQTRRQETCRSKQPLPPLNALAVPLKKRQRDMTPNVVSRNNKQPGFGLKKRRQSFNQDLDSQMKHY